jgi:hypothetical protein
MTNYLILLFLKILQMEERVLFYTNRFDLMLIFIKGAFKIYFIFDLKFYK